MAGAGDNDTLMAGNYDVVVGGSGNWQVLSDIGSYTTLLTGNGSGDVVTVGDEADENTIDIAIDVGTPDSLINVPTHDVLEAGSGFNTTLLDWDLNGTLFGGAGTSTLIGFGTGNTLIGGTGRTVAYFSDYFTRNGADRLVVDLNAGTATEFNFANPPTIGSDRLIGISAAEVVNGILLGSSAGGDWLKADSGTVIARGGGNTLVGGGPAATLLSDEEGNTLIGGMVIYGIDNQTVNLTSGVAAVRGTALSDTLIGVSYVRIRGNNVALVGGTTDDEYFEMDADHGTLIDGTGNGDQIYFNDLNAGGTTPIASLGRNTIIGGAGTSVVMEGLNYAADPTTGNDYLAFGNVLIAGNSRTVADYDFPSEVSSVSVNLQTGLVASVVGPYWAESLGPSFDTLIGFHAAEVNWYSTIVGSSGSDLLVSDAGINTLIAGSGTETLVSSGLSSGDGRDTLVGGAGTTTMLASALWGDTLIAGTGTAIMQLGAPTYYPNLVEFARGDGTATIESGGPSNQLAFGAGIADNQLWFVQSANGLEIEIMGTKSEVTVSGSQLQEIMTADGMKLDGKLAQLVQAMATYSAANPGFDPTASGVTQAPNDAALQSAIASAWHS
jgi:hypothetical protein